MKKKWMWELTAKCITLHGYKFRCDKWCSLLKTYQEHIDNSIDNNNSMYRLLKQMTNKASKQCLAVRGSLTMFVLQVTSVQPSKLVCYKTLQRISCIMSKYICSYCSKTLRHCVTVVCTSVHQHMYTVTVFLDPLAVVDFLTPSSCHIRHPYPSSHIGLLRRTEPPYVGLVKWPAGGSNSAFSMVSVLKNASPCPVF